MKNNKREFVDGVFIKHEPCPKCGSTNNLGIYEKEDEDGVVFYDGNCFTPDCGYMSPKELQEHYPEYESGEDIVATRNIKTGVKKLSQEDFEYIESLPSKGSRKRKLKQEFMQLYGIKVEAAEDGKILKHYYPVTKDNAITGYKIRELPKTFSATGDCKKPQLFGQAVYESGKAQCSKKFLLATEGELDAVALKQVMDEKGNPMFPNAVVSINNGSGGAVKAIQENWKWVNTFDQVVLFFDQDEPGKKAALEVAKKLPLGKVKIAKFSEKDPCDMLKEGKEDELYNAFWKSELYAPDGVLSGSGLWNLVDAPLQQSDAHYPWKGLDKMLHAIRSMEMITLTAGCVDADTEFLTPTGWKKISSYSEGDLVAQYSEDGFAEFVEPLQYHKYVCESLWSIRTKYGVNQVLSDEHNVVFSTESVPDKLNKLPFSEVRKIHSNQTTGFRGKIHTTFKIRESEGIPLSEAAIRLQVAVMADGSFRSQGTNHASVRIKKERKKQRLEELLNKAGVDFSKKDVEPTGFTLYRFYAPLRTKNYDSYWWSCSPKQMEIICDEVLHWDGTKAQNRFFSSDIEDIDFLQYAFASIGKRTSVSEMPEDRFGKGHQTRSCYSLTVCQRDSEVSFRASSKSEKPSIAKYVTKDGYKYCFSVSSGMLILRRENSIFITGNSGVSKSTMARFIAHHLQKTTDDNIGMIFLEESVKKTALTMMSIEASKPFHIPETEYTAEEKRDAFEKTLGTGKYYFFDDFASQDFDSICESILYMARAANVKYIFLDHISMLVSGGEHGDERRALDAICTKLRSMVQQLDITLFAITHLKRPNGVPHEEGGQTSLAQLRGSAGIAQLSDTVIGFERNMQADDPIERNTTHVRVLKNRFSGECGLACSLLYDSATGLVRELSEDEVEGMDTNSTEFDNPFEEELDAI